MIMLFTKCLSTEVLHMKKRMRLFKFIILSEMG